MIDAEGMFRAARVIAAPGDRLRVHLVAGQIDLEVGRVIVSADGAPVAIETHAATGGRRVVIPWTSILFFEELPPAEPTDPGRKES